MTISHGDRKSCLDEEDGLREEDEHLTGAGKAVFVMASTHSGFQAAHGLTIRRQVAASAQPGCKPHGMH